MGDALIPSFQRISSHRLQIIYFVIGIKSPFECLETCSHQWQVLLPSAVFGNTSMPRDRWILSSVRPQHIYSHLLLCTLVPWFPFSLLVGDLASVNGIHQWPIIRRWTTMFDLDTSIHILGHVLIVVCVEELPDWWHLLYATSFIVPIFMRFHLSWLDSSICQTFPATMEILSVIYLQPLWRSWSFVYLHHGDSDLYILCRNSYQQ